MSDTQVQVEGTNLAMVRETVFNSATVPATGWKNTEPNSYGNFGPTFKKVPRDFISKLQQLRKGMLTDVDSGVAFEGDLTKEIIDLFAEGIFRCHTKHSGGTDQSMFTIEAVTATGFQVAADGDFQERSLLVARGLETEENNGLFMVGAGSIGTESKVAGLVAEASPPANALLEFAGFRFANGDLEFNSDGDLICTAADFTTMGLNEFQWVYVGNPNEPDHAFANEDFTGSVRIRSIAAKKLTLDRRNWIVEQAAYLDLATIATQLDTVVQAQATGVAGNSITVAAVADGTPAAKAELALDPLTGGNLDTVIRAKIGGTAGNLITVEVIGGAGAAAGVKTEVGTHVKLQVKLTATPTTVAQFEALVATCTLIEVKTAGTAADELQSTDTLVSTALAGGTAATAPSVSEIADAVTLHYTPGATTVAQLEAVIDGTSTKIEVKTPGTQSNVLQTGDDDFGATALAHGAEGTDDGAGQEVDLYFSRWYRNVATDDPDYHTPSYAFEETYPELINGAPGYEYMLGNMIDEWVWNFPLAGKATVNVGMIGTRSLKITGTRKAGPADALDPVTQEGVSTSTDLQRLRVSGVDDEVGISTDFQMLKITNKNNVSAQKQLAVLGARKLNLGKHTVAIESEAIFTDPEIINAVADNRDATLDILTVNDDFGALLDVLTMTLDSGDKKMEKDKAVIITSKAMGHVHPIAGSTNSLSVFAFLPQIAQNQA